MTSIRGLLTFFLVFLVSISSQAQFEGFIEFVKTNGSEATTYKYYVKGSNVRVEELTEEGHITGIMLVDTKSQRAYALNPDRRLYMTVPNGHRMPEVKAEVDNSGTNKKMFEHTCEEITVTSEIDDRMISYWVATDNFDFFIPLLETLNRKDKLALYYQQIEGMEQAFPLIGEERSLDGTLISKLETVQLTAASVDLSLFSIPEDYSQFDR